MSRTLLYTVQRVLEKLDLDDVNSINDSQDAILVSREAETTFYDLMSRNEWPERYDIIEIESVSDLNLPTALKMQQEVLKIASLRYNITDPDVDTYENILELKQLDPEDFLNLVYSRRTDDDDVVVADYKGIELFLLNDYYPTYFTTFDNKTIILDSWMASVEDTVQGSKTVCQASYVPVWEQFDDYIIPMDDVTYPLYLSELAAACSTSLNGVQDPEEERRRRMGMSRMRRAAFRTDKTIKKNNFGRMGNGVS